MPLCLLLVLPGCGTKAESASVPPPKPFAVALDAPHDPNDAALYAALAAGEFRAAGLGVELQAPPSGGSLGALESSRASLAVASEPELLLARDRGAALVSIGALVQQPLAAVIAPADRNIAGIGSLRGKRVGTAGLPAQAVELRALLARAGVPASAVTEVDVGFEGLAALVHRRVEALVGLADYQALALARNGARPVVIPVRQSGMPAYDELVLVARQREAEHDGEDLRAFLYALRRGARQLAADPAASAAAIASALPGAQGGLEPTAIRALLRSSTGGGEAYGYQDPAQWSAFARWMYSRHFLRNDPAALSPPFTNEFLPGQGLG